MKRIDWSGFLDLLAKEDKLANVLKCIREIDKESNGYVTIQELDDIFKVVYPEALADKDIKRLFRRFSSIQNTLLIDYKMMRDCLVQEITKRNQSEQGGDERDGKELRDFTEQRTKYMKQEIKKKEISYINYHMGGTTVV